LYNILIEFGRTMKLVMPIKCLNEIYCGVQAGKHLSDMLPVRNGVK
jgi:hypothetical protein